ncbi:MAG: molybdopterin molybdotransferase MoeA [Deltaproteobacteria bacterium]|nr:molybdopterin molybdotransferase MoeA [Deltaproteobacteria bacterium]
MISFEEAKKLLGERLRQLPATDGQTIPLSEALGRVTAEPILAPISVPLFDNSAMDGFALRSADTINASPDKPLTLTLAGETKAGDPPIDLHSPQAAIRIMTGAPIPLHANAVIKKEETAENAGTIQIVRAVEPGENIRKKGEDFKTGDKATPAGTKITPGVAGLFASLGIHNVAVKPRPRVSIIATGHELVSSIEALKPGKILESNSVMLKAALAEIGISPNRNAVIEDDPTLIHGRLVAALEDSDIIIVTGGVSVGDYDHTRTVLNELGVIQLFWKVAQKPGKPLFVGTLGEKLVFGLPGNPYAVFVCFYLYIRPALLTLMGDPRPELKRGQLKLSRKFLKKDARTHFLKGKTVEKNGESLAEPLKGQGSHLLGAMAEADILICVPADATEMKEGDEVEVFYLP